MKFTPTPLGEVLRHRKGSITIDDLTSYKLCRVQLHRRGVVLRQHLRGAEIRTKSQQVCRAGDFLIAEMDAKVGGYGFVPAELDGAIVSSHYFLFEIDEAKLFPPFLEVVSQAEIIQQQIVAKGSTNYASVRPSNVLSWKIPLPDLATQKRIAHNFSATQAKLAAVGKEITHQESLLSKLKQAILQEAIEGKLTAGWRAENPDVEPASELLKRIHTEKARLVAAKKLRAEKPLPPIKAEEVPFEVPEGWTWVRLGTIARHSLGKMLDKGKNSGIERPYLRNINVRWYDVEISDLKTMPFEEHELEKYSVRLGDVLICEGGHGIGRSSVWNKSESLMFQKALHRIRFFGGWYEPCLFVHFMKLCSDTGQIERFYTGAGIPHLTGDSIHEMPVPLPPLAEQEAIVERVEELMESCRALADEIERAKEQAGQLLQAVLKEAFAGV